MIEFRDILYGSIKLPDWMQPFLTLPEFVRLRGVRLSNVDSFQFKDLSGPSRWEHGVAVAWLALRCADKRRLAERDRMELALAALLHDVATPPFAHTAEYVLEAFDHELESQRLLTGDIGLESEAGGAVFASQVPQFRANCRLLSKTSGVSIDPDRIAQMIVGDSELGFLVHGSVDLDNADNVTRACCYLGVRVNAQVPIWLSEWLATQTGPPTNLREHSEPMLTEWLRYREELYSQFYESSDAEIGRQAFLQHLMRRGIDGGLPRSSLIWSTDERLLCQLEQINEATSSRHSAPLQELVQRYRLLEAPTKIGQVDLFDDGVLQSISLPQSVAWIEHEIATQYCRPFVIVLKARHGRRTRKSLLPASPGSLYVFKLGGPLKELHLPESLQKPSRNDDAVVSPADFSSRLAGQVNAWAISKPWNAWSKPRSRNIVHNLNNFGDWSFRLSRNESLHAYPGTYVNAIPAAIIAALGVQGDIIVDPFGGTGQTAFVALRHGCKAVTSDSNYIATLAARARLTYLPNATRDRLKAISAADIQKVESFDFPDFDLRDKWFHPDTLVAIGRIKAFIDRRRDPVARSFLLATLSSVLTLCSGRRGKEHGYFADNTPLEAGVQSPPFQDAIAEFIPKLLRNVHQVERFYSEIERDGSCAEQVLLRATVSRASIMSLQLSDLGIEPNTVGAIITSPPYLCMADYSLGQRLSYEMLFPSEFKKDVASEIGKRRQRFQGEKAVTDYLSALDRFSEFAARCLRIGGYVATVLGTPTADRFKDFDAMHEIDRRLQQFGFIKVWEVSRPINWHRNHGYSRLSQERVAVHRYGG